MVQRYNFVPGAVTPPTFAHMAPDAEGYWCIYHEVQGEIEGSVQLQLAAQLIVARNDARDECKAMEEKWTAAVRLGQQTLKERDRAVRERDGALQERGGAQIERHVAQTQLTSALEQLKDKDKRIHELTDQRNGKHAQITQLTQTNEALSEKLELATKELAIARQAGPIIVSRGPDPEPWLAEAINGLKKTVEAIRQDLQESSDDASPLYIIGYLTIEGDRRYITHVYRSSPGGRVMEDGVSLNRADACSVDRKTAVDYVNAPARCLQRFMLRSP